MTGECKLMEGKRGLVMGVANDKSIAWGMAKTLHEHGAELAFTYQGEAFGKRVKPLAESVGSDILVDCDVTNEDNLDEVFSTVEDKWGSLDFQAAFLHPHRWVCPKKIHIVLNREKSSQL